jgi:hypothetical protein
MRGFDERWDERDERTRWARETERGYPEPRPAWGRGAPPRERADLGWPTWGQAGFEGGAYAAAQREGYEMPGYRAFGGAATRAVPGPYSGIGPRNYRRSDQRIYEDICDRLTDHGLVDASEIEVTVTDGEVTLSGSVADRGQKRLAEDMAEDVAGVRDVHNQLRVRAPGRPAEPAAERQMATP